MKPFTCNLQNTSMSYGRALMSCPAALHGGCRLLAGDLHMQPAAWQKALCVVPLLPETHVRCQEPAQRLLFSVFWPCKDTDDCTTTAAVYEATEPEKVSSNMLGEHWTVMLAKLFRRSWHVAFSHLIAQQSDCKCWKNAETKLLLCKLCRLTSLTCST